MPRAAPALFRACLRADSCEADNELKRTFGDGISPDPGRHGQHCHRPLRRRRLQRRRHGSDRRRRHGRRRLSGADPSLPPPDRPALRREHHAHAPPGRGHGPDRRGGARRLHHHRGGQPRPLSSPVEAGRGQGLPRGGGGGAGQAGGAGRGERRHCRGHRVRRPRRRGRHHGSGAPGVRRGVHPRGGRRRHCGRRQLLAAFALGACLLVCAADQACGTVSIANYNCPGQLVIGGDAAAVERACVLALQAGAKRCQPLRVSGAFHTP